MEFLQRRFLISMVVLTALVARTDAHFIFVSYGEHESKPEARLYFSESSYADAERLPEKIAKAKFSTRSIGGKKRDLAGVKVERDGQPQLVADLKTDSPCSIEASCTYGVYQGFLLTYYAKHLHFNSTDQLEKLGRSKDLALDVEMKSVKSKLQGTVYWQGKPAPDAKLLLVDPSGNETESSADENGHFQFSSREPGLYGIRAHYVENDARGRHDGKEYESAHHYSTLTVRVDSKQVPPRVSTTTMPEALASFGAVVCDECLYVYGGHIGKAHHHSKENLSKHFRRLRLAGGEWESLPMQTPVQGLALIAHGGFVYRIGGMTAKNPADQDADLHSTSDFRRFDPKTKKWTSLPSIPKGRSSHDAVVIGDRIYVCGGWTLKGESEGEWHTNTIVFDLAKPNATWESLPEQPFERRALAASHFDGNLYVIGGMNSDHDIDRSVNVFEPKNKRWIEGPELPGEGMNGFGASAWNDGSHLYVSGSNGIIYRLHGENNTWEEVGKLETPRFFHQLVPSNKTILAVGGASMKKGHLNTIEQLHVAQTNTSSTTQ